MSIFKDTFKQDIQNQLNVRQEALFARTPNAIQYFNARNAWIRMSSSVNVKGSNDLAKKYVLQGGILANGNQPLSGVGLINQAYSLNTADNASHRLGIRPMPGITGIDIKSKSAYGSLREVEVKFNAWDIKQLEELELLYMRPGYTVLIEWGWAPYLDNNNTLQASNIDFYDILNQRPTKEQIFKELYDTAVKKYSGNYDAMFGYIKNYSWSARDDGGYDCTTTIISVGEVMESLKVNYAPFNNIDTIIGGGGIISSDLDSDDLKEQYSKNILAGLFYEIWNIGEEKGGIRTPQEKFTFSDKKNNIYHGFRTVINISGGTGDSSSTGEVGASDVQVYITLESLCTLINNYVTVKDSNSNSSFVTCSVFDREYDKDIPSVNINRSGPVAPAADPRQFNLGIPGLTTTNTNNITPNFSTGEGGYLLCLAHPLQISMDPSVCLINSPVWADGILPDISILEAVNPLPDTNVVAYTNTSSSIYENLIKEIIRLSDISDVGSETENELIEKLSTTLQRNTNEIKQLSKIWFETNPTKQGISLYNYLDKKLTTDELNKAIGAGNIEFTKKDPSVIEKQKLEQEKSKAKKLQEKAISEATSNLAYLKELNPFYYKKDYSTELGIIGNIYVNVNFLYRLALNDNLESSDTKEQNDITLYNFLKSMLSQISSAIGSVNNFDIHVDPIDSIIRIIDVNYVDEREREKVYDNLFTLQLQNTKSTVRSYKLESQIFPDQSATIAIGAQVGGGAMATDNNTMLDFNKGLEDRIIPKKDDPLTDSNQANTPANITSQLANLTSVLDIFYKYFNELKVDPILGSSLNDADFDTEKSGQYKNALRDLIKFYQNLTNSNTKNRSIIPTKLSITMDGIGGLIIGHMFKIPEDLLPKGYKGGDYGSKLGYTVTSIGHSVSNNDWTTNIDAQTIILDNPSGTNLKYSDLVVRENRKVVTANSSDINKAINANQNFRVVPILKNLVTAAKQSIGFSTAQIRGTDQGNVGCAAAVSVIFLRATGNQLHPFQDIELSTSELYNYLLTTTTDWKKRDQWEKAQPGDIIVTSRGNQAGHTGVIVDTRNSDGSYNIISNSSSGFAGSDPGTIQQNYSVLKWGKIYSRNPRKTAAFEYIGGYN